MQNIKCWLTAFTIQAFRHDAHVLIKNGEKLVGYIIAERRIQ